MGNGSLRFKDNSGNVISFISGSGTDIVISGGTLNLLGMTEVALGNVTISGSTLVNGTQGNQGPTGLQGTTGSNGAQGNQGPTGLQGFQGNQGTTGSNGAQGNQGPTGFQGFQGNQGPTGVQGTIGSQGNQGPTGLQGNQGNQGPTGLQGNQGNQGPTGLQGNQGPTGLQGFQGNQGTTGLQGSQGNQGPNGLQGNQGPQGNQGIQGATGASAGITSYTNPDNNRVLTSVSSTEINAEANLVFDGTNLGIGTTSPGYSLQIKNSDASATVSSADGTAEMRINAQSGLAILETITNTDLRIRTNSTERMRITSGGNVGIGTTVVTAPLTVAGTSDLAWSASTSKLQISRSGTVARLQNYDNGSASSLSLQWDGGNVGIGTTSPTSNLSFDGGAARTIGMERVTTSNTAGNNLTISASSATIGATDKNGGDVVISGGIATGTGSSRIVFRTATANFSTGTGDRTPSDKVIITGNGTIIQNGVSSTFVTGTCTANQTVNISFTTVTGGRLRVHAIITPTDGTSIGAQKMSVIGNSTGGISEVVISNTTTATIGSWTFSGSGTFFGVTKNAGSAATACTYLIEVMGNLA